jgi:mRNA-degrading endonuclease RelE of RelBE toxin-antitoxin system
VELTPQAERDLRHLRGKVLDAAVQRLNALASEPEAGESLSANLKGVRSLHWQEGRVQYRAAYVLIDEKATCLVFQVGTRENFYKEADRRRAVVLKAIQEGRYPSVIEDELPEDQPDRVQNDERSALPPVPPPAEEDLLRPPNGPGAA